MNFLRRGFKTIGFKGDYLLGLMDDHHVLIRFQLQEDYQRCWLHQIWEFKSHKMRVLKWTPFFHKDEEPLIAPIWVAFEHLSLFMFKKEVLFSAGQIIGKPLKTDAATEALSRPSVARLCVEVDLLNPLPKRFWIGQGATGFWQIIKYESIPEYCFGCQRFGHLDQNCGQNDDAPLVWRQKTTNRLEIAAKNTKGTTKAMEFCALPEVNHSDALPEVNHSDIPLANTTDLQKKNLDLDSIVKPVVADGSVATDASNTSDDKPSTQTARQNATQAVIGEQAENLPISGSPVTNILVISSKDTVNEVTMDPGDLTVPENAQQLNTMLLSDTPPAMKPSLQIDASLDAHVSIQPPSEPVTPNLSKTVIVDVSVSTDDSNRTERDCENKKSSSSHNSPILLLDFAAASSATQKSELNPNAAEFLLATTPNIGVSPVASAPSPVAPNLSNDNLLNYTSTSLSDSKLLEHRTFLEKSQVSQPLQQTTPYKLPHIGMHIMYPTFESNTQNDFNSLQASDEEEEEEYEHEHDDLFDKELVRDDTYLDMKNAQRKACEREQQEMQFR